MPKLRPVVPLDAVLPKLRPVVPIDPSVPTDPMDPKLPLPLVAALKVWLLQTPERHSRLQQSELPWQESPFTAQLLPVVPELMPEVAVWPEVVPEKLPEVLAEWPLEEVPLAAAVVPLPFPFPLPLLLLSTRHRPTVSEQLRPVQQVSPLAQLCACSAQVPPVVPLDELLQAANRQRALTQAAIFKTVSSEGDSLRQANPIAAENAKARGLGLPLLAVAHIRDVRVLRRAAQTTRASGSTAPRGIAGQRARGDGGIANQTAGTIVG